MSGPVRPPLEVKESDDSVEVRPTNVISFDSSDFNITKSGTTATITTGGTAGTIGGSITSTQVAFGAATANSIEGSANFTFTEETGGSGPIVLLTGDKPIFRLQDDTDATDYKSSWEQSGNSLYLYNGDSAGNNYEIHRISPSYVWWNRGNDNLDMFYDSANIEKFFTIDVSQDNVGIGAVPPATTERLHVAGTGTGDVVVIESTDTGSSAAPDLVLYRGVTGANADYLGNIKFRGQNDASEDIEYAVISSNINRADDGDEEGWLMLGVMSNGTFEQNYLTIRGDATQVVINEGGHADIDFRVEGDTNTNLIRTVASQDNVGIGGEPVSGGATLQCVDTTLSYYKNLIAFRADAVATMDLTNDDCQGGMIVYTAATAVEINLPGTGVKGQWFEFVSTDGDITIDPQAGQTLNGGTGSLVRSTNNEVYTCICLDGTSWILSNPA